MVFRIIVICAVLLTGVPASFAQQLLTKDSEKLDFAHGLLEQSMFSLAKTQFEEFISQFPQSAFLDDAYLGAGESHFFLKEYDAAADLYQKYIAQFPSGKSKGIAQVRLGQCLYLTGKYEQALAQLTGVNPADLTPPFVQTLYFFTAQAYAVQNKAKEAASFFEKAALVADAAAYTPQAFLQWASALGRTGEYPLALEKAAKALELAPNDDFKISVLMKQGEINFLMGAFGPAAEIFKKVADNYPSFPIVPDAVANWFAALSSQKQYEPLIAEYNQRFKDNPQPAYIPVHLSAAKALSASGKLDEALAILDRITVMPSMTDAQKSKAVLLKIDLLVRSQRFAEALPLIDAQLTAGKTPNVPLMILRAQTLMGVKDYDKALDAYQKVAQDFVDTAAGAEAVCGMGYVRHAQAQNEQAAGLFMDCFNKSQDENLRSEALYHAFLAYDGANITNKAAETGEQYLKTFTNGARVADVTTLLAGLYSKTGQYDKAIAIITPMTNDADESRRQNANFQVAYNLQLSGKADQALALYEKLIAEHKSRDQIYYLSLKNAFMIYLQKKDEDKAADVIERAIKEYDNNDVPLKDYLWLAQYWMDKNNPQAMLVIMSVAERLHAQTPGAVGIKYFMAEAYRLESNWPEAIRFFDAVIADANNGIYKARAHLGKALSLSGSGDFAGANTEFELAVSQSLDDKFVAMRARFEMAKNLEMDKKIDEAAKAYMVVAVLYKDDQFSPESLLRAGDLFKQLNNMTDAVNAYKQVISQYPASPQAAKAQEHLNQPQSQT